MTTVGTGSSGIGGGDVGERRVLPGRGDERRGRGAGADHEDGRVEDERVEAETGEGDGGAEWWRGCGGRRVRGRELPAARTRWWSSRARERLNLGLSRFREVREARWRTHM